MPLKAALEPQWLRSAQTEKYHAESMKLLDFFVTHSPCKYQSFQHIYLQERWGTGIWLSDRFLKDPLDRAISEGGELRLYKEDSKEKIKARLRELGLEGDDFISMDIRGWAVYTKATGKGNGSRYMSLFYHLRNSFAHGRWAIQEGNTLVFEDGKPTADRSKFEVSARGMLSLKGMLRAVELLREGPKALPRIESQILNAIRKGINRKAMIIDELDITNADWKAYSHVLSSEGRIRYKNKRWHIVE